MVKIKFNLWGSFAPIFGALQDEEVLENVGFIVEIVDFILRNQDQDFIAIAYDCLILPLRK